MLKSCASNILFIVIIAILLLPLLGSNIDSYYQTATTEDSQLLHTHRERNPNSMLCMDIRPQHSLNIEHITGRWYGSEIIMHTQDVPGIYRYDSCVIIYLNDITAQMRGYAYNVHSRDGYRQTAASLDEPSTELGQTSFNRRQQYEAAQTKYLRLVWSENTDNLEYTFNYTEQTPGYWTNVGEQRGSLVSLNHYTQFTGSVQVVKAVNDHLVLTFCGNDVHSSIYTLVLSRNSRGLKSDELRSIRNLLSRRGLSTESIRQVCISAAAHFQLPLLLMAICVTLLIFMLKTH